MNKWINCIFFSLMHGCFAASITLVNHFQSTLPNDEPPQTVIACIYDAKCLLLELHTLPFGIDPITLALNGVPPFQIQWLDSQEKPIGITNGIQDGEVVDSAAMTFTTVPICGYTAPKVVAK